MQKFTRALTREIEIGGERLAVTLDAEGLTIRPVGSRRPPHTQSWAACVCAITGPYSGNDPPSETELAEALKQIKAGAPKDGPAKQVAAGSPQAAAHDGAPIPPADENTPVSSAAPPPAQTETSVPALLARVERWLAVHRDRFHRGLLPGATELELAALREALGGSIPAELAELLRWHGGQSPEVPGAFEQSWNLMSAGKIASTKRELDGRLPPGWHTGWVPFFEDEGGSYLLIDTAEPGHPVRTYWNGNPEHKIVAPSLAAWLQNFVVGLEAGKYHEDPERGTLHRAQ